MPAASLNSQRLHGLDTLRAFAIVLVMLYHLQKFLPSALTPLASVGWIGVDLFFVLSGFLIGSQLIKPYLKQKVPSLKEFYSRRAYRILPAYLVVLGLYCVWPAWREAPGPYDLWQYLTFTWNLVLRGYPTDRAFSQVWSLCVEEHFYLLLPCLVLLIMKRPTVCKTAVLMGFIVGGGMALRWWLLYHVVKVPSADEADVRHAFMKYIYYPTYTRLDGLVMGVALAVVRTFRTAWWNVVAKYKNIVFCGGIALIGSALWAFGGDPEALLPLGVIFGFPVLSLGFGLLVISAISEDSLLSVRVAGVESLATLAFSLYLTHKSVVHVIRTMWPTLTSVPTWKGAAVYAAGCIGTAYILYFAVERPFLVLRAKLQHRGAVYIEGEVRNDPAI